MPPSSRTIPALPPQFKVLASSQIASLWSNYGHIYRLKLASEPRSLILKSIHPPVLPHPDESHLRKLLSYDIERWFYRHLASQPPNSVKLGQSYPLLEDAEHTLLLEDLSVEFPFPASGSLGKDATICVLTWLAGFHGTFSGIHHRANKKSLPLIPAPNAWKEGSATDGVWQRGTYWYLDTRREELAEIDSGTYKWLFPWIEKVTRPICS